MADWSNNISFLLTRFTFLLLCCRDGGLKRAKVKDSFKEEQQKNYSKMLVRNGSVGSLPTGTESD